MQIPNPMIPAKSVHDCKACVAHAPHFVCQFLVSHLEQEACDQFQSVLCNRASCAAIQAWADLMGGISQEGAVSPETAAAAEQVFRALVDGSLQDMATGAAEVRIIHRNWDAVDWVRPVGHGNVSAWVHMGMHVVCTLMRKFRC